MIELEWIDVPAGDYEIGLRPDEARALAERTAKEARVAVADDPDQLYPEREQKRPRRATCSGGESVPL